MNSTRNELIKSDITEYITLEINSIRNEEGLNQYTDYEISTFIALNQINIQNLINEIEAHSYDEDEDEDEHDLQIFKFLANELYAYIDFEILNKLDQTKFIKRELLENSAKINMNPNRINRLIECGLIDWDNIETLYDL